MLNTYYRLILFILSTVEMGQTPYHIVISSGASTLTCPFQSLAWHFIHRRQAVTVNEVKLNPLHILSTQLLIGQHIMVLSWNTRPKGIQKERRLLNYKIKTIIWVSVFRANILIKVCAILAFVSFHNNLKRVGSISLGDLEKLLVL